MTLSARAVRRLAYLRELRADDVDADGIVLSKGAKGATLWGLAGLRAHQTLIAALGEVAAEAVADNEMIRFPDGVSVAELRSADVAGVLPAVPPEAVSRLKFSAALPVEMATATLAERFVDRSGAERVVASPLAVH